MATATEQKDGIEQVREILVGAIQRDLERRVSRLESRFVARINELEKEARRRTDVIEAHLKTETESLSLRLQGEIVEIKDALRALTHDHRDKVASFDQRVGKMEENLARGHQELRQQILDQAKTFLDELHHTREELTETLDRELAGYELETQEESASREPGETAESASH
jgi:hypothetical protein